MAKAYQISKSSFVRSVQCLKSLYLYKHNYDLIEQDDSTKFIFQRGTNVGLVGRDLFKGGFDATPPSVFEYHKSVALTHEEIRKGTRVIYEACFIHNQVLAAVDILVFDGSSWSAYEIKSSTSVKDEHITDAALQYHVLTGAGMNLKDIYIVHLDNTYIRQDTLNIKSLFKKVSVLQEVKAAQPFIEQHIETALATIALPEPPTVEIGNHCFASPFDCSFIQNCWKAIPPFSVYELDIGVEARRKLVKGGIMLMKDVPDDYPLTKRDKKRVEAFKSGITYIDQESIRKFIADFKFPLYCLDTETINPPIPLFKGTKCYSQVLTQMSIHKITEPGKEPEHFEFLAEAGPDPRRQFAEELIEKLGDTGTVLIYSHFENTRLSELKELFPEYTEKITKIQERIIDLIIPFRKGYLYAPSQNGSNSIKDVLPAFVDLNYSDLHIADGLTAVAAYESLFAEKDAEVIRNTRQMLLAYCERDTYSMVKLVEKLYEFAK